MNDQFIILHDQTHPPGSFYCWCAKNESSIAVDIFSSFNFETSIFLYSYFVIIMWSKGTKRTGRRVGENMSQKKFQNSNHDDNSLKKGFPVVMSKTKYCWLQQR